MERKDKQYESQNSFLGKLTVNSSSFNLPNSNTSQGGFTQQSTTAFIEAFVS